LLASTHLQHTLQHLLCTLNCSLALASNPCTVLVFSSPVALYIIKFSASSQSSLVKRLIVLDSALQLPQLQNYPRLAPPLTFAQPAAASCVRGSSCRSLPKTPRPDFTQWLASAITINVGPRLLQWLSLLPTPISLACSLDLRHPNAFDLIISLAFTKRFASKVNFST
jgi:hypothetical protein